MEERMVRPEMEERMTRPEMEERMARPEMEERMARPEMEEKLRVPVSLEKPLVNQEIIDSESKNEMKKRLQHQVKCGTFINPKYQKN